MNRPNLEDLEAADPFVPLLIQCLHTRHGKVASLALKCLCQWMILPFPSLKDHATEVGRSVIQLLDSVPNTNDEVAQDCLKLLAKILHNGETFQPTHFQVNPKGQKNQRRPFSRSMHCLQSSRQIWKNKVNNKHPLNFCAPFWIVNLSFRKSTIS